MALRKEVKVYETFFFFNFIFSKFCFPNILSGFYLLRECEIFLIVPDLVFLFFLSTKPTIHFKSYVSDHKLTPSAFRLGM